MAFSESPSADVRSSPALKASQPFAGVRQISKFGPEFDQSPAPPLLVVSGQPLPMARPEPIIGVVILKCVACEESFVAVIILEHHSPVADLGDDDAFREITVRIGEDIAGLDVSGRPGGGSSGHGQPSQTEEKCVEERKSPPPVLTRHGQSPIMT